MKSLLLLLSLMFDKLMEVVEHRRLKLRNVDIIHTAHRLLSFTGKHHLHFDKILDLRHVENNNRHDADVLTNRRQKSRVIEARFGEEEGDVIFADNGKAQGE